MRKLTYYLTRLIILFTLSFSNKILAQEPTDDYVNNICTNAKDYWGCVRSIKGKPPKWKSYGPLKIDWSVWRNMQGSQVAQALNGQDKGIYLAINCLAQKINVTGANGNWKGWNSPTDTFEIKMINDLCKIPLD